MKVTPTTMAAAFGSPMKKTSKLGAALLAAVLAAGCNKVAPVDVTDPAGKEPAPETPVTLTVSAASKDAAPSRITYGAQDAAWETGDKIFLVKNDGTTITLTLVDGAGTSSGTFTSTDPVVAGTYIPYAVSAASLSAGFVNVENGVITLDLSCPGGSSLDEVLQHDILKGDSMTLTADQATATVTGLTTHFLSYIRFTFHCDAKAVESIGMDSAGGLKQTVTIAANGTVSGGNPSTEAVYTEASGDGDGNYAGYFAVYGSTGTSLMAHAFDEDGASYTRLVSTKTANYTAGTVYGKRFTLSQDMVTSAATGTLSGQGWKNLGLSVRWAEFNVGSSSEYSYDRNVYNGTPDPAGIGIPAGWNGWRMPTRAEAQELFYASQREWVTGSNNGVKFNCNENYVAMGAGGYYRDRGDRYWEYNIGEIVYFYIAENAKSNTWYAQYWAIIGGQGSSLSFSYSNLGNSSFDYNNAAAQRLVNDYMVLDTEAEADRFLVGNDSYDDNDFE